MTANFDPLQHWHLEQIFADLAIGKALFHRRENAQLAEFERKCLQGILQGLAPRDIAKQHYVDPGGVRKVLAELRGYIAHWYEDKLGQTIEVKNWHDIRLVLEQLGYKKCLLSQELAPEDRAIAPSSWEGAPKVEAFFGRDADLQGLQQELLEGDIKVLQITGSPGIGKTALAYNLTHKLADEQQFAILWISMATAPPLGTVLDKIQRLWGSQSPLPDCTVKERWQKLLDNLPDAPWLIVLDGMETTVKNGKYTETHAEYASFFRQVSETSHQGRVLVTSTENIVNLCVLEQKGLPVKLCRLKGLDKMATGELLKHLNVSCKSSEDCGRVQKLYDGNPQFIRFLAVIIREMFQGELSRFTQLDTILLDEHMQLLMETQWERLSPMEQAIAQALADANQPLSLLDLRRWMNEVYSTSDLINSLKRLQDFEFVEQITGHTNEESCYQIRPLVKKYLSRYLNRA